MPKRFAKLAIISLLLVALIITSATGYAYWIELKAVGNVTITFEPSTNNELQVQEITQSIGGVYLVPEGRATKKNEVESVYMEYRVSLKLNQEILQNLEVSPLDVMIDGKKELGSFVVISIDDVIINAESTKKVFSLDKRSSEIVVRVYVTLREPKDSTEMKLIEGKDITFKLKFEIVPNVI